MKRTLLIIGGSGFFGKSIIDFLEKKRGIEKKINKIIIITKSSNVFLSKKFKQKFQVNHLKQDISKIKNLPFAHIIIYCAISYDFSNDIKAVTNFCNIAKHNYPNSKIIYTSSGAVYGKQTEKNFRVEEVSFKKKKIKFENLRKQKYAEIKIKNEKLFQKLLKYKIKISIVRCFAFAGKHLPLESNFVLGNFIYSIIKNKTINFKSESKVLRTYMHSDDLADCLLKIGLNRKRNYEIYNLGSEDVVDIYSLSKYLGKKFKLKLKAKKQMKHVNKDIYIPDTSKFRKDYKYKKKLLSFKAINKTIREIIKFDKL